MFVVRMGRVSDGFKVFGITRRTADVFRRTTTGGFEQEGKSLRRGVLEPFFELDHMVPAVAEVIEIMDRLGASLANDIARPRFAGIHGLVGVIVVRIWNPPTDLTSEELEEVAVRPAKCRLKRQMQPIQAQGDGYDEATHHLRFHVLEVTLIRTAVVFRLMPPASDRMEASCRSMPKGAVRPVAPQANH